MIKRFTSRIAVLLVIVLLCAGCSGMEDHPATQFYTSVLDAMEISFQEAVPYIHYEREKSLEMAMKDTTILAEYKIQDMREINPNLWVFTTQLRSAGQKEFKTYYHFVGMLDGTYYLMVNTDHIPEELRDGLNPEEYTDPNSLGYDEALLP